MIFGSTSNDVGGEICSIYELLTNAAKEIPTTTVIANGDSPLFNSTELPNPRQYFGFNHEADHDSEVLRLLSDLVLSTDIHSESTLYPPNSSSPKTMGF